MFNFTQIIRNFGISFMQDTIIKQLMRQKIAQQKQIAVLIDPDKASSQHLAQIIKHAIEANIGYFLVGGSLLSTQNLENTIRYIKRNCTIPVVLFPGSPDQVHRDADAILLLSLISGRNPELLIGAHVQAAPKLKNSGLEIIPTAYILIDGGKPTTVSYISNTLPIPADKPDIAAITALAGAQLGLKLTYLDAGSGAKHPVSPLVIGAVKNQIEGPLFVGGGIKSADDIYNAFDAGANVLVIGNLFEEKPHLIAAVTQEVRNT